MDIGSEKALWQTMGGNDLRGQFPSPWIDMAMRYAPRTIRDALTLCEFLYVNHGVYRKASEKIVDYFLTKLIFKNQDDEERKKFELVMNSDFQAIRNAQACGYDKQCYGNSFASLHFPFRRMLRCVKCKTTERSIDNVEFEFRTSDFSFYARCPKCRTITRHMVHNYRNVNSKKIRLIRWDPKRIIIEHNPYTDDRRYWLDISPLVRSKVMMGDKFVLSTLPWPMIRAIQKNQKFLFEEESFYHMYEPCPAGMNLGGWGLPSVLSAFKNFFRIQMLMRYDEVLMMDYIVPLRILSPQQLKIPVGNDFVSVDMDNFIDNAQGAIQRHRMDGADWAFIPFGVNYQAVGGEGQQLSMATKDVLANEEDRLLQIRGLPVEIYKATLTTQVAPVGLRLFERSNTGLVSDLKGLLQWSASGIARYLDHGSMDIDLESVRIADNIEDQQMRLQMAMSNRISMQTGVGQPLDIDMKEENKRLMQEAMDQQKQQAQMQQDLQMQSMSLDSPQGEGSSQNQSGGMNPMDVEAQGDEMARQLADPQMPEINRRQQLSALSKTNPTLHAVVLKKLDQLRNQAGTLGQAAGMQQMGIGKQGSFGKSAAFDRMFKHHQILWMAEAFFPSDQNRGHDLGYEHATGRSVLRLNWKGAGYNITMADQELERDPMELMANVAELVTSKKEA